jgi:hypothetical protein
MSNEHLVSKVGTDTRSVDLGRNSLGRLGCGARSGCCRSLGGLLERVSLASSASLSFAGQSSCISGRANFLILPMSVFRHHKFHFWFLSDSIAWRVLWLWGAICASALLVNCFVKLNLSDLATVIPIATASYVVGVRDGRRLQSLESSGKEENTSPK